MSTPNPRPRPRRSLGRGGAHAVPAQAGEPEAGSEPESQTSPRADAQEDSHAALHADDTHAASAAEAAATDGPDAAGAADAAAGSTAGLEADSRPGSPVVSVAPTAPLVEEDAATSGGDPEQVFVGGARTAHDEGDFEGADVVGVPPADTAVTVTAAAIVATDKPGVSDAGVTGPADAAAGLTPHAGSTAETAPADAVGSAPVAAFTRSSEPTIGTPRHEGFAVRLDNFEGPFDLLLSLIAKHKLDVTEVSLSKVTDEFIAYIRAQGADWDLGVATEFLVVAATLLDLKAARLLPVAEIEDEEDLALLEARDLLFARLLQYRAYKEIASILDERWAVEGRRYPRDVPLEERYTGMLPELVLNVDLDRFARLAARAMTPKSPKLVSIDHIHAPRVSVREQSAIVVERLRAHGALTFRALIADCPDNLHVIARFLCLLELFRESAVGFDQVEALGELHVRWTGGEEDAPEVGAEFDEQDGTDGRTDGAEDVEESHA